VRLGRASGDQYGTASALQALVVLAISDGKNDEATTFGEEALAIFESLGMPERISDLQCGLGRAAYAGGDLDRAFSLLTASLSLAREVQDPFSISQALTALALVCVDREAFTPSAAHFGEALAMWLDMGSKDGVANSLAGIATLAAKQRRWDIAAQLFGAVSAMQVLVGTDTRVERVRHLRGEREAAALGGAAYGAAFEAGRTLRIEAAIAEASMFLTQVDTEIPATPNPYGLTAREREVLRLLAEGRADREIAAALSVGPRTVETHVRAIRGKLGVDSRTAAAALALRDGLV
jgi:DNA-binding CsgD family transcriptional regulator